MSFRIDLSSLPHAALAVVVVACSAVATPAFAEQFEAPSLDGYNMHNERDADGDGDGVNETHIIHYLNQNGDSLVSMSTKGVVWAWSLNSRESETGDKNYVMRDSDCDGVFDEVYSLDEEFHVPECMKSPPATQGEGGESTQ